jgi:hypothetical protein
MKKPLLNLLLFLIIVIMPLQVLKSQFYLGGEITWECLSNGKYVFTLKVYRDCGGPALPNIETINSTSPIGNFNLTLEAGWPKDISPVCNANPAFSHITCAGATTFANGSSSEYIWKSGQITLNGIPPANGWFFYWGTCCRSPATNINNASSLGYTIRSVMYPYNSNNMYPCFDNSPTFAEPPKTIICKEYPINYIQEAYDKELDSLVYNWGQPWSNWNTPVASYAAGYSYFNPLPGVAQNPNNVPAMLNSQTGELSFTSHTTGAFVTDIKVTAFKCGIKVAEIHREMQVLLAACDSNPPPIIYPPFNNGSFIDSVIAGDSICFNILASDFDMLPNNQPQSLSLEVSGGQLGSFIPASGGNQATLSTTMGCINPPCATLTPVAIANNPVDSQFIAHTQFCWQTDCSHLATNIGCGATLNVYNFIVKVKDDYCPVPAFATKMFTIVVVPKPPTLSPMINCSNVLPNGDVELNWIPSTDAYNSFMGYNIYTSNSKSGPFTLLDSMVNLTDHSYTHIGANATLQPIYYFIKTKNNCGLGNTEKEPVDTVATLILDATVSKVKNAHLEWNPNHSIQPPQNKFKIYKKDVFQNWVLIDSTIHHFYNDVFNPDNLPISYRIEQESTLGIDSLTGNPTVCESVSNVFTLLNPSIENQNKRFDFLIVPNPFTNDFTIKFSADFLMVEKEIMLFSVDGRLIFDEKIINKLEYNVSKNIPSGIYYITIKTPNNITITKKVVKI